MFVPFAWLNWSTASCAQWSISRPCGPAAPVRTVNTPIEALHGFPVEDAPVVVPDAELLELLPPHPAAISASVATTPPSIRAFAVIRLSDARLCVRKLIKPPPVVKRAAPICDRPDRAGLG